MLGLKLWEDEPDPRLVQESTALHASYYRMLGNLLDGIAAEHPRFVVLDVHSYNHRREGPDGAPMAPEKAPDINIGTSSMPRDDWAFLVDPLMEAMRGFDFNGRRLDVRENVAFKGKGEQTRFVHEQYPGKGCAIALEFKKFYMDEWTGAPDPAELAAMRAFITFSAQTAAQLLAR
ncbi:N-formylglutamate amidohydrolase [Sphingomonas sp. HDW15A]|uniref:N-formylglutamate amidohydrolase n=1 Tax=Sphingomonas sp. HDW15A TaxID=2714942 RepID=UPI0019D071FC